MGGYYISLCLLVRSSYIHFSSLRLSGMGGCYSLLGLLQLVFGRGPTPTSLLPLLYFVDVRLLSAFQLCSSWVFLRPEQGGDCTSFGAGSDSCLVTARRLLTRKTVHSMTAYILLFQALYVIAGHFSSQFCHCPRPPLFGSKMGNLFTNLLVAHCASGFEEVNVTVHARYPCVSYLRRHDGDDGE